MIHEMTRAKNAAGLFAGWQETMVWSCLQGVMGRVYGDDGEEPVSAMALLGDFCFFAGKPHRELVLEAPGLAGRDFLIMTPRDEGWAELIEDCHGTGVKKRAGGRHPERRRAGLRGFFLLGLPGRHRDRNRYQGRLSQERAGLCLRGEADTGLPGAGMVPQLGRPEPVVGGPGGEAGIPF